jgi:hypothetical protein
MSSNQSNNPGPGIYKDTTPPPDSKTIATIYDYTPQYPTIIFSGVLCCISCFIVLIIIILSIKGSRRRY